LQAKLSLKSKSQGSRQTQRNMKVPGRARVTYSSVSMGLAI